MSDKHEMPVLAEGVIESLIEFAELSIAGHGGKGKLGLLMKIALAALTAHSVGDVVYGETSGLSVDFCDSVTAGDSLYTAPPVPTLKPVKLPELPAPFGNGKNYANKYRELFVEAIKAAGGTVEGDQ